MDMFFQIHDKATDTDLQVNVTQIRTYSVQDQVDRNGTVHNLIVYGLKDNRFIEEEFTDVSARDAKLKELSQMAL